MRTRSILVLGSVLCAAVGAWGQSRCCITQASGYAGGSGTASDPYLVCLPVHLNNVRNNLGAHFVQTSPINMAGINHVPIGTPATPFTGTYDGQNYPIENLGINNAALSPAGLFGQVGPTGVISNVQLIGVNMRAGNSLGAIAGNLDGLIQNCSGQGRLRGRNQVGGLVGTCISGDILQSYSTGTVEGENRVGGLVGEANGVALILDCYSRASATATMNSAGGLLGVISTGNVSRCYSNGRVLAAALAGGLIGTNGFGTITHSFWDINTSGQAASAGGVGITTAVSRMKATFDPPWDFATIWTIVEGVDAPRLLFDPSAPPAVSEQDQDNDGVPDGIDACPHTVAGVAVSALGCPNPLIPFDTDLDGDVDLDDEVAFNRCMLGPIPASSSCEQLYDVNADSAVDLVDFAAFQGCFSGAGVAANPKCLGAGLSLPAIPPVQVALNPCTRVLVPAGARYTLPDRHFHRVTLTDPLARCNDATPAVMYIRTAPVGSLNADKWVIYFKGGGACRDFQSCEGRWCGVNPPFDATLMTTRFTPVSRNGNGIFLACAPNSFADYNHVWLEYCSSDNWSGTRGRVVMTNPSNPAEKFSIMYNGHFIVEAALNTLDAGAVSDNSFVTLPSLMAATEIVWTGSSAGGGGMERHLDWAAARYPAARSVGVRDAGPGADVEPLSGPVVPTSATTWDDVEQELENRTVPHIAATLEFWNPFIDESCALLSTDPTRCGIDATFNHITTPFFVRLDLTDPVANGTLIDVLAFLSLPTQGPMAFASYDTLQRLKDIQLTAIEAAGITTAPGIFGPYCGRHEAIYYDNWFFDNTVDDATGAPVNFHDAVRAWMDGTPTVIIDNHVAALKTSVCP